MRELRIKAPQVNKGLWEQINFIKGLSSDYVHDIYVDNQNKIWYGCHTGLTVYDGNQYRKFGIKEGLSGTAVIKIVDHVGRCAAINVDPEDGCRGDDNLLLMNKSFGHTQLGVFGRVIKRGILCRGDKAILIDDV